MKSQPAYDEITLSHGKTTVRLRPSLRAATHLEAMHDGFETLFRKVEEFDTGTIKSIITISADDRGAADALMKSVAETPLGAFARATHAPVIALCRGLIPAASTEAKRSKPAKSAAPLPWSEVYRELYRIATGWLQWTPTDAWNATPTEIEQAYIGLLAKLKAIHGSADDPEDTGPTPDQREANIAAGLDPEFDREGLRAMKARMQGGL